jgi:hypothetical protein
MVEATASILPQPGTVIPPAIRASMSRAVGVLVLRAAKRAVKEQLRRRGLKLASLSAREIALAAEDYAIASRAAHCRGEADR